MMKKYRKLNMMLSILLLVASTLCSGFAAEDPLSGEWTGSPGSGMASGEGMQYNMRLSGMPAEAGLPDGSPGSDAREVSNSGVVPGDADTQDLSGQETQHGRSSVDLQNGEATLPDSAGDADTQDLSGQETQHGRSSVDPQNGEATLPDSADDAGEPDDPDESGVPEQGRPDGSNDPEETGEASGNGILSFSDVMDEQLYYYRPVYWAAEREITNGLSENRFGPEVFCTRAQIVTFLWRAAGQPEPESPINPFQDVEEDAYYMNAILWAVEQGVTRGLSETAFGPEEACTRAQCVTFLWRYQSAPVYDAVSDFRDVPQDAYYAASVFWALKNGVTNGNSSTEFSPESLCTRGHTVTFFYRAMLVNTERDGISEEEPLTGQFRSAAVDGTKGEFTLTAEDVFFASGIEGIRAFVWTQEDQSDIRWFAMNASSDESTQFQVTQRVETFRRYFGTYYASLYMITKSGLQIHLDDLSFAMEADNYMYAEELADRTFRVTLLGAPDEVTAMRFLAWSTKAGRNSSISAEADQIDESSWTAVLDLLDLKSFGECRLEACAGDPETVLNAVTVVAAVGLVIDVSQYQGTINWTTAWNSGRFDAVIIRCGLRGNTGRLGQDSRFATNANQCVKLGIPMGFYWFTQAKTVAEARAEADYCAGLIRSYPHALPVFIDTEPGGRAGINSLSQKTRTACIVAFLERMKQHGHETGIYASDNWFFYNLNYDQIRDYNLWTASWSRRPTLNGNFVGWQYTAKEKIPGITQNVVDVSFWFRDIPAVSNRPVSLSRRLILWMKDRV